MLSVMVIVIGNRTGDSHSNYEWGYLDFTTWKCMNLSVLLTSTPAMDKIVG